MDPKRKKSLRRVPWVVTGTNQSRKLVKFNCLIKKEYQEKGKSIKLVLKSKIHDLYFMILIKFNF